MADMTDGSHFLQEVLVGVGEVYPFDGITLVLQCFGSFEYASIGSLSNLRDIGKLRPKLPIFQHASHMNGSERPHLQLLPLRFLNSDQASTAIPLIFHHHPEVVVLEGLLRNPLQHFL